MGGAASSNPVTPDPATERIIAGLKPAVDALNKKVSGPGLGWSGGSGGSRAQA
jgi:hypothetical protein